MHKEADVAQGHVVVDVRVGRHHVADLFIKCRKRMNLPTKERNFNRLLVVAHVSALSSSSFRPSHRKREGRYSLTSKIQSGACVQQQSNDTNDIKLEHLEKSYYYYFIIIKEFIPRLYKKPTYRHCV